MSTVPLPTSALSDLLDSLQIERLGPALLDDGQPAGFRLVPPASELRITSQVTQGLNLFPVAIPVTADITWQVFEANGTTPLPSSQYLAPDGLTGAATSFILAPLVIEATDYAPAPLPIERLVSASVTLS